MNHRRTQIEAHALKIRQVDSSCSPEQLHPVPLPKGKSMVTPHVQLEPSPQSIIITKHKKGDEGGYTSDVHT